MAPSELREQLFELADPAYRLFHLKTCPQAQHLIGVRIPEQRKLAKTIVKHGNYYQFLDEIQPFHYEEVLITGIVIATAPMSVSERLDYTSWFMPFINNWAICDTFCNSFTIKTPDRLTYWDYITSFQHSTAEYELRFMFVMILDHFLDESYLSRIFELLDHVKTDQYYVQMAKAWLIAELFTEFRTETFDYLERDQLSTFEHDKAIQKACESRRISANDKQHLRSLKL